MNSNFDKTSITYWHDQWQNGSVWRKTFIKGIKQTHRLSMKSTESLSFHCHYLWLLALTLLGRGVKGACHNCECVICACSSYPFTNPRLPLSPLGLVVLTGDKQVQLSPLLLCQGQRPSVPAVPLTLILSTPRARWTSWHCLWQQLVGISCLFLASRRYLNNDICSSLSICMLFRG